MLELFNKYSLFLDSIYLLFIIGFKVSTMSEGQTNHHEVNKEICNIPGFLLLNSLIPKHIEVAEIYHLVIALLLGHPVSGKSCLDIFFWKLY